MISPEPPVEVRRARPHRSGRARHLAVSIVVVAVGAAMVALASLLPESTVATAFSPTWWPTAIGMAIVGLGALLMVRPSEDVDDAGGHSLRMVGLLVTAVAALAAWATLGFLPAALGATVLMLLLLGCRRPLTLILLPLVLSTTLYAFFALLLRVPL